MKKQGTGIGDQGSGIRDQGSEPNHESRVPQVSFLWKPGISRLFGPAIICLAALLATAPDLIRGNSCGHDFDFHLVSWLDAQSAWRHGLIYPHWAPSPNYGAGEPRFVFYPPLTWMLGAAFGLVLPWKGVQLAIVCSFLAFAGLATRALARQLQLADAPATLAGCIALFSGYSMFSAYERSAFGELAGGFWIPLLLLLVLRDRNPQGSLWRRAFDGSAVLLALVVAGAWLSNAPLGVMASYLLAAVALAVAIFERSWHPILRSTVAVTLGIGLSAIYLVPATVQQPWVQIRQATDDPGLAIENSFLFGRHADPNLERHDVELWRVSIIAVIMICATLLCIFLAWRQERLPGKPSGQRSQWIPLALIPVAILLLQLPISLPIWNAAPKLRYLQFPWRWLVALEAPLGIFFAVALWPARRWLRVAAVALTAVIISATTLVTFFLFHQGCDAEDAVRAMIPAYRSGQGFEGSAEYAPPNADNTLVAMGLPDACLTSSPDVALAAPADGNVPTWDPANGRCDATYSWLRPNNQVPPEHLRLAAQVPHTGFLVLRLRSYAAWQVRVNGRLLAFGADPILPPLPGREDGLMVVPVSQGPAQLSIDWATTRDEILGRRLSVLALILLSALYFVERRSRSHPQRVRPSQPKQVASQLS